MPAIKNTASPYPFQSLHDPLLHTGVVSVTGSLTVDLGIGHNNFVVQPCLKSNLAADANAGVDVTWNYGTKLGTFVLTTWKSTSSSVTTLIAATSAVNVSFIAIADSSVG